MSPSVGQPERGALAEQVRSLASSLVAAGNTNIQGQYIFAGSQTGTAPLQETEGANLPVLYRGNHHHLSYQIRPDEQITVSFTGAQVFNYPDATGERPVADTDRDVFSLLADMADAMERGDTQQLQDAATQLDKLHAHVVNLRGQGGTYSQRCARAVRTGDDAALLLSQILADEESVDTTAAVVELSNLETTYQAALSLTQQMLQMPNLFDLQ